MCTKIITTSTKGSGVGLEGGAALPCSISRAPAGLPTNEYEYLICGEPDAATTQERRCMIGGALCALCERVTFVVTGVLVCVTCAGGVPLPGRAL